MLRASRSDQSNGPMDSGTKNPWKFCLEPASDMNALRLFNSWVSRFPGYMSFLELSAPDGDRAFPYDERVIWGATQLGGFSGKTVLELGPLEAYNTTQIEQLGAASVLSIEANQENFLKCLIIKNIFNLKARFLLGDAGQYIEKSGARFDIVWASGIIYHLSDPIRLLEGLSRTANQIFIWTQYFEKEYMGHDESKWFIPSRNRIVDYHGRMLTLHYRSYRFEDFAKSSLFTGGEGDFSFWMEKADLMYVLDSLGFPNITMGVDNPHHGPGPACFFIAKRD